MDQAQMWDAVAPAWERSTDFVDGRTHALTSWLLDAAEVRAGDQLIDLGCGPGGAGLAAAARVGPTGRVVLSDVSPAMVAVAQRRAQQLALGWVEGRVLDASTLGAEPEAEYDVALSRDGIQFAPSPDRTFAGIAHVLKPGGRLALGVWGAPKENPWLALAMDAAAEVLGRPVPQVGAPGPFSLGDHELLTGLLEGAGFEAIRLETIDASIRPPSPEAWAARSTSLSGPLAAALDGLPGDVLDRIQARAVELAEPYVATEGGLHLPGSAILVSARRP